jgi:putative nucleotidyltransferase with HDIG domain
MTNKVIHTISEDSIKSASELWPELNWISDLKLREQTLNTWALALQTSPLTVQDLNEIPFTLLVKDCTVTFMEHKRAVVHISRDAASQMTKFFGENLPIDMDTVISGAILCDVGKLLEYEKVNGIAMQSDYGKFVRHPFSGVGLAMQCGVPDRVLHIIAAHAGEGDKVKRSTEAYIVHHADFMSFLPFMNK